GPAHRGKRSGEQRWLSCTEGKERTGCAEERPSQIRTRFCRRRRGIYAETEVFEEWFNSAGCALLMVQTFKWQLRSVINEQDKKHIPPAVGACYLAVLSLGVVVWFAGCA